MSTREINSPYPAANNGRGPMLLLRISHRALTWVTLLLLVAHIVFSHYRWRQVDERMEAMQHVILNAIERGHP